MTNMDRCTFLAQELLHSRTDAQFQLPRIPLPSLFNSRAMANGPMRLYSAGESCPRAHPGFHGLYGS